MQTIVPSMALADQVEPVEGLGDAPALVALYERSADSVKGYAKMVEKAEPSFRATADRFRALHSSHAEILGRLLTDLGVGTEADGSVMGLVNRAVVTFRAFFDDIDDDVMDQVRSGEDWVLKAFDAAIAEQPEMIPALRAMRDELADLLADTRDLG